MSARLLTPFRRRDVGNRTAPRVDVRAVTVAVVSDVHANTVALEAVLSELVPLEPDLVVFGGDLTWGPEPEETSPDAATPAAHRTAPVRSVMSVQSIAAINSRDDALHALELASNYFRDHEPSSPLPLLIDRAKRLAPMPFLDILRDLAPDGLAQAQTIAGTLPD